MSYFELWGMKQEPFSNSPDPNFFYLTQRHKQALDRLEIGIRLKRGLSTIIGPIGSGKTTLSRALLQRFFSDDQYEFYFIFDPSFRSDFEFLHSLARVFKIFNAGRTRSLCKAAIEDFLFDRVQKQNKTIILIIDESQKLNQTNLEHLRILLNYESNDAKFLQLILLGQPELYPKIFNMENLADRIHLRFALEPLTVQEVSELIHFRLTQAGLINTESRIDPELPQYLWEKTKGLPRKIIHFCHHALTYSIAHGQNQITNTSLEKIFQEEDHFHEQFSIT